MKTEYRIFPNKTYIGDLYLQFKDNDEWCYVPKEQYAYVSGSFLKKSDCPSKFNETLYANCFLHCFADFEDTLKMFAKKYENIDDYFEYLNTKRISYLEDKKRRENLPITYL